MLFRVYSNLIVSALMICNSGIQASAANDCKRSVGIQLNQDQAHTFKGRSQLGKAAHRGASVDEHSSLYNPGETKSETLAKFDKLFPANRRWVKGESLRIERQVMLFFYNLLRNGEVARFREIFKELIARADLVGAKLSTRQIYDPMTDKTTIHGFPILRELLAIKDDKLLSDFFEALKIEEFSPNMLSHDDKWTFVEGLTFSEKVQFASSSLFEKIEMAPISQRGQLRNYDSFTVPAFNLQLIRHLVEDQKQLILNGPVNGYSRAGLRFAFSLLDSFIPVHLKNNFRSDDDNYLTKRVFGSLVFIPNESPNLAIPLVVRNGRQLTSPLDFFKFPERSPFIMEIEGFVINAEVGLAKIDFVKDGVIFSNTLGQQVKVTIDEDGFGKTLEVQSVALGLKRHGNWFSRWWNSEQIQLAEAVQGRTVATYPQVFFHPTHKVSYLPLVATKVYSVHNTSNEYAFKGERPLTQVRLDRTGYEGKINPYYERASYLLVRTYQNKRTTDKEVDSFTVVVSIKDRFGRLVLPEEVFEDVPLHRTEDRHLDYLVGIVGRDYRYPDQRFYKITRPNDRAELYLYISKYNPEP